MKTYVARIQTQSGTQIIELNAASIEDAATALQLRVRASENGSVGYTIQEQSQPDRQQAIEGLMNASGALLACLLSLVIADHLLRKWLKH